jgi:chemotaxis protein histidine kinase CheA
VRLFNYLKAAFLYRWNLLAFLGGMGFALVSGRPDVFCPLVLAGEVAYLGLLGTHPRFQEYVNAREAKSARREVGVSPEQAVERILTLLPEKVARRFEALRAQCLELRQIAREIRGTSEPESPPLEELQLAGLDRLLWIYLRLLFTQHMLERFFQRTSQSDIQKDIDSLQERLGRLAQGPDDPQKQRVRKTLDDNLTTCRERLANFQKARDNSEFVQLEIERLENKIRSLSELAVNRQEPGFISSQVDQVASGLAQTERTMSELQFATGLQTIDEEVPELLQRKAIEACK